MMNYLSCIKQVKGTNEAKCRNIAKSYLSCRMDRYDIPIYYFKDSSSIWDIGI